MPICSSGISSDLSRSSAAVRAYVPFFLLFPSSSLSPPSLPRFSRYPSSVPFLSALPASCRPHFFPVSCFSPTASVLLRFCLPALFHLSAASLPVPLVLLFWSFSPSSPAFASFFLSRSPPAFPAPLDSCSVTVRRMPNLRPESSVFLCVSEKIVRSRDNFLTIWNSCNILDKSPPGWRRHKAKNRKRMIWTILKSTTGRSQRG